MEFHEATVGAKVYHPTMGQGVVYDTDSRTIHCFFKDHGEQPISRSFEGLKVTAPGVELGQEPLDIDSVQDALRDVLEEMQSPQRPVSMHPRYEGGMMELKPKDTSLKSKELPIEDFFHKIVTIRWRSGIEPTMRVVYDGNNYQITAVLPDPSNRRWLTLMCQRGVNSGE